MLLTNRRTLLSKQIDIENEIRGTLREFGIKLTGGSQPAHLKPAFSS
jgi:transposase